MRMEQVSCLHMTLLNRKLHSQGCVIANIAVVYWKEVAVVTLSLLSVELLVLI